MTQEKRRPRCPTCRTEVELRIRNESFPFCSERCRLQDLAAWLDERYRIPVGHDSTERSLAAPLQGETAH